MHDSRFLDLDRHGVLRIPGLFWLGVAFLARHWLLMVAVAASARRGPSAVLLLGESGIPWTLMLLELPIVLLAFAGFNRRPDSGAWARLIWRRGREIVALQVLLNIGWTASLLAKSSYWLPWPELFLGSCALLDLAIAVAMYQGAYFRQLFLEFPAPQEQADPSHRRGTA